MTLVNADNIEVKSFFWQKELVLGLMLNITETFAF